MPKQCSTRSTPAKRRTTRKKTVVPDSQATKTVVRQREEVVAREYADEARRLVLAAWPEIVRGLIKKAVSGGYQQTKLLLELSALENCDASTMDEQRRQQLCDALLEGLGLSISEPNNRAVIDDHL